MLLLLLVISWAPFGGTATWYSVTCSEKPDNGSLAPSHDGVGGRYVARYCAESEPQVISWELELRTLNATRGGCDGSLAFARRRQPHSRITVEISYNLTCPYVCLQQTLDLLFESCYVMTNKLLRFNGTEELSDMQVDTYHYINNRISKKDFLEVTPYSLCSDYGEEVVCNWLEGPIPYTDYTVNLWLVENKDKYQHYPEEAVTENCTRSASARGSVRCSLRVPAGAYAVQLTHSAAWTSGFQRLVHSHAYFNRTTAESAHSDVAAAAPFDKAASGAGRWVALGGCALLLVSLAAGLVVYHKRVQAKKKLRVLQTWIARSRTEPPGTETDAKGGEGDGDGGGAGTVLVLYARDCPPAQRVADALIALLKQHHGGKVLDLYSPAVNALAARSPSAFVRECMSEPGVSVLLLQTPALPALHSVRFSDLDSLTLEEPLLGTRAVYSSPVFGDGLLGYALQLMREQRPQRPYRKYRLATLSELSVDAFPSIVPYTRFCLPQDAPALLHSLCPPTPAAPAAPAAPTAPALAPLAAACTELVAYVKNNSNYLTEQIQFM